MARGVLDRNPRLAEEQPRVGAVVPQPGQVRVQRRGPVDEGGAVLDLADDGEQGTRCRAQGHRVLAPEIGRPPCQLLGLGDVAPGDGGPAERLALQVAARRHAIGRREAAV
jgi:hypothetical protein